MVLVFIDHSDEQIKKSSFEVLSYGAAVAEKLGTSAAGLLLGNVSTDLTSLGNYGISVIYQVNDASLNQLDAQVQSQIIAEAAKKLNADVIIFSHNQTGRAIAPSRRGPPSAEGSWSAAGSRHCSIRRWRSPGGTGSGSSRSGSGPPGSETGCRYRASAENRSTNSPPRR